MFIDADEIYEALTKKFRIPPDAYFWEFALDDWGIDVILEATDPDIEREEFEKLSELFRKYAEIPTPKAQLGPGPPHVKDPDPTLGALSLIFAAEAKWLPEVVRFRQRVLGGEGVSTDRVADWIAAQIAEQGPPTVQLSHAVGTDGKPAETGKINRVLSLPDYPPGLDLSALVPARILRELVETQADPEFPDDDILSEVSALEAAHADPAHPGVAFSLEVETLKIAGHPLIPIDIFGPLGKLKQLAKMLTKTLGFDEGGWALYVLSNSPPEPNLAVVKISTGPVPAMDQISIQASPLLGLDQIRTLYSEARKSLASYEKDKLYTPYTFDHPISDKHILLAIFIAQQNNGHPMADAMSEWNRTYSHYRYNESRNFDRDARAAYRRVTGKKLKWRRRRGRPSSEHRA
jgi:hypothetical protein